VALASATLRLTAGTVPVITAQPQNLTVTAGNTATFTATASGSPAPSYQWQREPVGTSAWSNLSNGGSYSGVATATLIVSSTTTAMSGDQFRCGASNSLGSTTSQVATLTVTVPVTVPRIESVIYTAGAIRLSWHALAGRTYQVQFKGDLNQASWSILGQFPATGSIMTALDSSAAASSQRFYRIVLMQ